MEKEFSVKDTNMEALRAKKSAIECGYMKDAFINYFVPEHVHKEILMHRGYWSRFWCFNSLTSNFLKSAKGKVQILSVGCGLDTMAFNLLKNQEHCKYSDFCYFECDLKDVVEQKIDVITKNNEFIDFLNNKSQTKLVIEKGCINSSKCPLIEFQLSIIRLRSK